MSLDSRSSTRFTGWLAALRIVWIAQAVAAMTTFADDLAVRSAPVRVTAQVLWWSGWFVGLLAVLIPSAIGLTALRLIAPGLPLVAAIGTLDSRGSKAADAVIVALAVLGCIVVFSAETGRICIQGSAYGAERRFPLRPPGALIAGPIPLMWAASVGAAATGIMLAVAGRHVIGALIAVVGGALSALLVPRFHLLARRWLVFVPAGLVVHDHVPLAETMMINAASVSRLELAARTTSATDLTAGALGPAVEVTLRSPGPTALRAARGGSSEVVATDAVLVSPSRPGAVVAEARSRGW